LGDAPPPFWTEAAMDTERFTLEAPPCSTKHKVVEEIRRGHAECDRAARREPDCEAFRARAYFVMSNLDLVDCFDPAEGHGPNPTSVSPAAK
jgi:hypothetical protein